MKYKYNIKNLDCANCAKTIENKLNEDKNIKKAIVNFNSSTVTVETDLKDAFTYIKEIVGGNSIIVLADEEQEALDMAKEANKRAK